MLHLAHRHTNPVVRVVSSHPIRASHHRSDVADSCCIIPSPSNDDYDEDKDIGLHDELPDPCVSFAKWPDTQTTLPLFQTSPPLSPPPSSSSSSSSSSPSSFSDCSTSVLKPPPSILRFGHYSKSSTKFFFDVEGDDEQDDEEDEEDAEDCCTSHGNRIHEELQVPKLDHPRHQHHQFQGRVACLPSESKRDILWSPPPSLRIRRSFPSTTTTSTSKTSLARGNFLCRPPTFPTLGIQPMSTGGCHSRCDCQGCRTRPTKGYPFATATPSTSSSVTSSSKHLVLTLRPMVIRIPTGDPKIVPLSDHDVECEDDVSTLTHERPPQQEEQQPVAKMIVPDGDDDDGDDGDYDLDEPDLLVLQRQCSSWHIHNQQQLHEQQLQPVKRTLSATPTTTQDVWMNHELDWLTDEEDSLSTLTSAMSSDSFSSSYGDDDDEEEEDDDDENKKEEF